MAAETRNRQHRLAHGGVSVEIFGIKSHKNAYLYLGERDLRGNIRGVSPQRAQHQQIMGDDGILSRRTQEGLGAAMLEFLVATPGFKRLEKLLDAPAGPVGVDHLPYLLRGIDRAAG